MEFLQWHTDQDLAIITVDQRGSRVNTWNHALTAEFEQVLGEIEQEKKIRAVIIRSGKKRHFMAGIDLRLISEFRKKGEAQGFSQEIQQLFNRIQSFPLPVVVAINGEALGLGLELTLACRYRIAGDHAATRFGFPAVTFGLCPSGGGTRRLPRLVGLARALPMLLTGQRLFAQEAHDIGLIDEQSHEHSLLDTAKKVARELAGSSTSRHQSLLDRSARFLESNLLTRQLIFSKAEKAAQIQTRGRYPAPRNILECVRYGLRHDVNDSQTFESEMFERLTMSNESRQLIHGYFARQSARKNPAKASPADIRRIGIFGAGLMGSGIATTSIRNGFDVTLKDRDFASVVQGKRLVWQNLESDIRRGAIRETDRERLLSGLQITDQLRDLQRLPMIIEAIFEELSAKHAVLKEAETVIPDDAVFATNTSAIPISEIAKAARHPERVIGMHYLSPAQKMPLLEIVRGKKTNDTTLATACEVGIRQGKYVIVVDDAPGFYVTRILVPMINETMLLIEEGADIRIIDTALRNFGFPVGPVTLVDEAGIDITDHIFETLNPVFRQHNIRLSQAIHRLHEAGFAGRKNQRGFYDYRSRKKLINEEVYTYFGGTGRKDFSLDEITDRITLAMLNESVRSLQDSVLREPKDGDIGAVLGMGFPAFLGGPFRFIDQKGVKNIHDRLSSLHGLHGDRFKPVPLLGDMLKKNRRFYPDKK